MHPITYDIFMSTSNMSSFISVSKSETLDSLSDPVYVPDAKQSESIALTVYRYVTSRIAAKRWISYDIFAVIV